ncbi:hypothetical protein ACWCXH_33960 [Kitasatospora sp. NPDC001660]
MGRTKANKARRRRDVADHTLRQLEPPGYDEWFEVPARYRPEAATADPRLLPDDVDLLGRLARLRPIYGAVIPLQAIYLDHMIDIGVIPLRSGEDEASLLPLENVGTVIPGMSGEDLRGSVHRLHSGGALLVDAQDEAVMVRVVARRPALPGDPWLFEDDEEAKVLPKVCVPVHPDEVGTEEYFALAYLRSAEASGTVSVEDFADRFCAGDTSRAQEVFDSVAHLVGVRGCPACPSGHLCTREET